MFSPKVYKIRCVKKPANDVLGRCLRGLRGAFGYVFVVIKPAVILQMISMFFPKAYKIRCVKKPANDVLGRCLRGLRGHLAMCLLLLNLRYSAND